MATHGENWWPPAGRLSGRLRGGFHGHRQPEAVVAMRHLRPRVEDRRFDAYRRLRMPCLLSSPPSTWPRRRFRKRLAPVLRDRTGRGSSSATEASAASGLVGGAFPRVVSSVLDRPPRPIGLPGANCGSGGDSPGLGHPLGSESGKRSVVGPAGIQTVKKPGIDRGAPTPRLRGGHLGTRRAADAQCREGHPLGGSSQHSRSAAPRMRTWPCAARLTPRAPEWCADRSPTCVLTAGRRAFLRRAR